MEEWHIPMRKRGESGQFKVNFLWQEGPVYLMDNHLASVWCWLRETGPEPAGGLIHIDRHSDCLGATLDKQTQRLPKDLSTMSLDDYLGREYQHEECTIPVFCSGSYLAVFLELYQARVNELIFATHELRDDSPAMEAQRVKPWDLPECLDACWSKPFPWIVNVDLDFFFFFKRNDNERPPLFSHCYIRDVFSQIRDGLRRKAIRVVTIALSPEWCGGWEAAESLCSEACDALGIRFRLPPP